MSIGGPPKPGRGGIGTPTPTPLPLIPIPQLPSFRIPKFATGRVVGQKKGWLSVPYIDLVTSAPTAFANPPALLVVAESREGWFTPQTFAAPNITIALPKVDLPPALSIDIPLVRIPAAPEVPLLTLPNVAITIPPVTIPRTQLAAPEWDAWMQSNLWPLRYPADDWGPIINPFKDAIRVGISNILARLWDAFVQKQIDKTVLGVQDAVNKETANVQTAVNAALKTFVDSANNRLEQLRANVNASLAAAQKSAQDAFNAFDGPVEMAINGGFKANRDNLQAALDSFRKNAQDGVNGGFNTLANYSSAALNSVVPQLWALLGIPEKQLIVPALYKARLDGFDVYIPAEGVVVHYAAIGA
mgnify:CR=1 FL=1